MKRIIIAEVDSDLIDFNGDVVADACVFLASDKARFITGIIMPVSGGAELGYKKANLLETF